MKYRGDKTADMPAGTRLGPDHNGIIHEVTAAVYDQATGYTRITTRKLEIADRRLRFTGGDQ